MMKTPTLEELNVMTEAEFQNKVRQAVEELDKDKQPDNKDELDLLWFIGGYGGEIYRTIRELGINTVDQLLEARKKDPQIVQRIARTAINQSYPTYTRKKEEEA